MEICRFVLNILLYFALVSGVFAKAATSVIGGGKVRGG